MKSQCAASFTLDLEWSKSWHMYFDHSSMFHSQKTELVTIPLFNISDIGSKHGRHSLCLLQKANGGQDFDIWQVDELRLLPLIPSVSADDSDKVMQVSVNLACEGNGGNR